MKTKTNVKSQDSTRVQMDQAVERRKEESSHEDQDERKSRQTTVLSTGVQMDQARNREQEFQAGTPRAPREPGKSRCRHQLRILLRASLQNSSCNKS